MSVIAKNYNLLIFYCGPFGLSVHLQDKKCTKYVSKQTRRDVEARANGTNMLAQHVCSFVCLRTLYISCPEEGRLVRKFYNKKLIG